MIPTSRCSGLILAAGASVRMGHDKALLPWPPGNSAGATLLSTAIASFSQVAQSVIVVVGANRDSVAPVVKNCGAVLVVNDKPEYGQFSSLKAGLRPAVDMGTELALITPVDRPPLRNASLQMLLGAYLQNSDRYMGVVPQHEGRSGHPLLAGPKLIKAIMNAPDQSTTRDLLAARSESILHMELDDPSVCLNINTPDDYERAGAEWKEQSTRSD